MCIYGISRNQYFTAINKYYNLMYVFSHPIYSFTFVLVGISNHDFIQFSYYVVNYDDMKIVFPLVVYKMKERSTFTSRHTFINRLINCQHALSSKL